MGKWISVEDGLPNEQGKYLVSVDVGSVDIKKIVTIRDFRIRPAYSAFADGDWQKNNPLDAATRATGGKMIELTLYQQKAWLELLCYFVVGVYFCVSISQAKSQQIKSKRDAKERIEVHRQYCDFEDGVISCIKQSVITCAARKMTSANQNFGNEATDLLKKIVKFKWELE